MKELPILSELEQIREEFIIFKFSAAQVFQIVHILVIW